MSATEPITSIHAWQPNLRAAVGALIARGALGPSEASEFQGNLAGDVRAVLDASGANQEIESLRALLHAAHHVINTLRTENIGLLASALEPIMAAPPGPDELAAAQGIDLDDRTAAPGHIDGWHAKASGILHQIAEAADEPVPDLLAALQASVERHKAAQR